MLDVRTLRLTLEQIEQEKKIPREKLIDAIEQSLGAAYKKDFGKKGQIVRARIDLDHGTVDFTQVKIVVDEDSVRFVEAKDGEDLPEEKDEPKEGEVTTEKPVFNPEKHILIDDARKLKSDASLGDEIIFPLETQEEFGRIAAQTAKQVIIQRIRDAEKELVMGEFADREGEIMSGFVQRITPNGVIVDFGRVAGYLPTVEQIVGERFRLGERIRAYVAKVEDTPRGVSIKLSRKHPRFLSELFALEAPEVASGIVEIMSIAREPGSRSKVAVRAHEAGIDPIGSLVGQKGVRVRTVTSELSGEKIDIIEYNEDPKIFIANSLSPAKVLEVELLEEGEMREAKVLVADDQLSLAIGKGGQNVRLAVKLTGWKIDIRGAEGQEISLDDVKIEEEEGETIGDFASLKNLLSEDKGDDVLPGGELKDAVDEFNKSQEDESVTIEEAPSEEVEKS